ncbi:MAG: hypothetical protein AAFP84_20815, partial [Actinomycetota bacterium]
MLYISSSIGRAVALTALPIALVLSSCASDDTPAQQATGSETTETSPAPEDPPADSEPPTDTEPPSNDDSTGDTSPNEAATRTVEHALGTSEVPANPQRIVVLDSIATLDSIVTLEATDRVVGRINLS